MSKTTSVPMPSVKSSAVAVSVTGCVPSNSLSSTTSMSKVVLVWPAKIVAPTGEMISDSSLEVMEMSRSWLRVPEI